MPCNRFSTIRSAKPGLVRAQSQERSAWDLKAARSRAAFAQPQLACVAPICFTSRHWICTQACNNISSLAHYSVSTHQRPFVPVEAIHPSRQRSSISNPLPRRQTFWFESPSSHSTPFYQRVDPFRSSRLRLSSSRTTTAISCSGYQNEPSKRIRAACVSLFPMIPGCWHDKSTTSRSSFITGCPRASRILSCCIS